jgi:hypothetical protein
MSTKQIILLVISTIMMVLAIWNLVLYIQIEYLGISKKKDIKEDEEKKDYYGRLK